MRYKVKKKTSEKQLLRLKRHRRVRGKIYGSSARPRLVVFRSLQHIYAQIVDDTTGRVLCQSSTLSKALKKSKIGKNMTAAIQVGEGIAKAASAKDIQKIVFDCGGYKYHGRIKALADAARKGGLEF